MANNLEPPRRNERQRREQPAPKKAKQNREHKQVSHKRLDFKSLEASSKLYRSPFVARGGIDIPFFTIVIALMVIGLVMLLSASYPYALQHKDDSYFFFKRQLIFAIGGFIGMILVSRINFRVLKVLNWPIVLFSISLLILVLFYYVQLDRSEDFKRWIPIGSFTFQPSDLGKFALVLLLATYMTKYKKQMNNTVIGMVIPLIFTLVFTGLIFLEHHLSCTILMFMIGIAMMFAGGTRWQWFAAGVGLAAALVIIVVSHPNVLSEYQAERIIAWKDKGYEPLGLRWQTNNSLYAIGSGGFFGVGLGNSKQKFLYVSEPQNDFIFSIVCEELGFIGAVAIIALFGLLFYRGIKIAMNCEDRFGSLLVIGIVSQVAIQTIFNILVVSDAMPNTGIALPFFSYGGTALLILCLEMGVVLSVSRRSNSVKV